MVPKFLLNLVECGIVTGGLERRGKGAAIRKRVGHGTQKHTVWR